MSDSIVSELLQKWVSVVKAGDPKQVANLYHNDGMLLGTFSNKERIGRGLILEYFENLLKSPVEVEIVSDHPVYEDFADPDAEEVGVSCAANSGFYNFVTEGKTINARFSFVYTSEEPHDHKQVMDLTRWKIISHHSSVMPET
jgi:hypothetical protein